jgi:hypothetical protein
VEKNIEKIEAEIAGLDAKFANPDPDAIDTTHYDFFSHYQDLKKELSEYMNKWEELSLEVEKLKAKRN